MIEAQHLGKKFNGSWVFRDLSFHLEAGSSLAIIGPSGGGKTVLLKILAALLQPDEGVVEIQSKDIGMLFQKNALFDSLSVLENLLFPLKERLQITGSQALRIAEQSLESVGLGGQGALLPDELSGGMQKRLGIARALIVRPKIILYDEPTAGLDPITSKKIADLIGELRKKEGATVMVITNDVRRACQIGDEVALLAQGKLWAPIESGKLLQSQDPAVRQFTRGLAAGPLTSSLSEGVQS